MRWIAAVSLILPAFFISACSKPQAPPVDPALKEELKLYVREHRMIPELYVINQFRDHDVVFLGENHYVKHDAVLVRKLIPLLHERGVNFLCTEFARRVDQPLIDSLLRGAGYDEPLARLIAFRQYVHHGFQEYVDIFRAAWQLNRNRPERSKPFRILGINNAPDWSHVKTDADRDDPEVMKKVWHGEDESNWADVILTKVVARGEKALVYCGAHHAFTEYRQPIVAGGKFIRFGDIRAGNHVYNAIGKRTVTLFLHFPWRGAAGYDSPLVRTGDGYVDAILAELEPEFRRFGVDTRDTPFGKIPGVTSVYKHGYKEFTLATMVDGYVCQGPLGSYEGVTPIRDFVNDSNIVEARAGSPIPRFRNASPADFYNDAVRSAGIRTRMPE